VGYRPTEGAPTQEQEGPFAFTLTDGQQSLLQWYLEEYLQYPWGEWRTRAERAEALMAQIGQELFRAVFGDSKTAPLWNHVADHLPETRVVIHAQSPEAVALPWELLWDPDREEFGAIAPRAHAFVRSQPDLHFEPPPPPTGRTFNILLVICRPGGRSDIPFRSEARPLLELVRPYRDRVHVEVLRPPTLAQLARVLSERRGHYHVLHFDGHGAFPEGTSTGTGQGQLVFEAENGQSRRVTGEELGHVLADKGIPVVLLSACQSGMTRPQALYLSIANQLLRAGVTGVVAMTYAVQVQAAVRFTARLYEALMQGEELGRSVALAREILRVERGRPSPLGEMPLQDWAVPAVFEAAPVRVTQTPLKSLLLTPASLHSKEAQSGTEVNCPERPTFGFIGRDDLLLDLERAFREETVVLLRGMAGVGKTEAAVGFGRWWAETGGLDGPVFFFRFEHHLPLARVWDEVGRVFQPLIKEQLDREWTWLTTEQRRQVAVDILRRIRCLLIWDNFEAVAGFPSGTASAWTNEEQHDLRKFLGDLRGGQTKVLLTSRRDELWLDSIYRRLELGGLRLIEAQELAVKVLERTGVSAYQLRQLPSYNDLLEYLGGNPLAIQVIMPELAHQQPDALLAELRSGEARLKGDDPEQGRARSLSASLTYRLAGLPEITRQRLGPLALFQGFVNTAVLHALCDVQDAPALLQGLQQEQWVAVLDQAAEIGLLRRTGENYYEVHPALPWFLHDLLMEALPDQQAWLQRAYGRVYGAYAGYLAHSFHTNAHPVMSLLAAEEQNLLQALICSYDHQQWKAIEGVLDGLRVLFTLRSRWHEWERLVTDAETRVTENQDQALQEREQLLRALLDYRRQIAHYRRDFASEKEILQDMLTYDRQSGLGTSDSVLHYLGRLAEEERQWDEAERYYYESLALAEQEDNEVGQASNLFYLGQLARKQHERDTAEQFYHHSLMHADQAHDEYRRALCFLSLGRLACEAKQWAAAEGYFHQSLAIHLSLGFVPLATLLSHSAQAIE
jgi:tetratricopeptide (TPR) repeat protein